MEFISSYVKEFQRVLAQIPERSIGRVVSVLQDAWKRGRSVFIIGNGGSASTASHIANDLSKLTIVPGKPRMKVLALTDNVALITAWANDTSYDGVFKEQLENLMDKGDVVIAISASGNSTNVLRALEFATQRAAITIGWTGLAGGKLKDAVDYCIHCPTEDVGMIESAHMMLNHLIALELRNRIQQEPAVEMISDQTSWAANTGGREKHHAAEAAVSRSNNK